MSDNQPNLPPGRASGHGNGWQDAPLATDPWPFPGGPSRESGGDPWTEFKRAPLANPFLRCKDARRLEKPAVRIHPYRRDDLFRRRLIGAVMEAPAKPCGSFNRTLFERVGSRHAAMPLAHQLETEPGSLMRRRLMDRRSQRPEADAQPSR